MSVYGRELEAASHLTAGASEGVRAPRGGHVPEDLPTALSSAMWRSKPVLKLMQELPGRSGSPSSHGDTRPAPATRRELPV
jgi:hypothetical protein